VNVLNKSASRVFIATFGSNAFAYLLVLTLNRTVKASSKEDRQLTVAEVMREVSFRWSQMDEEAKRPYVRSAATDKLRYEAEMRAYKCPRSGKSKVSRESEYEQESESADEAASLQESLVSKFFGIFTRIEFLSV